MFDVKHRVLSGAIDENIGTLTAAVSLLGALKGLYSVDDWFIFWGFELQKLRHNLSEVCRNARTTKQ